MSNLDGDESDSGTRPEGETAEPEAMALRRRLRRALIEVAELLADALEGREPELRPLPRSRASAEVRRDGAAAFDSALERVLRGAAARKRRPR